MIDGHGDDIHRYGEVSINFSSNIYGGFSHQGLFRHLGERMHLITRYPEPAPVSLERELARMHGVEPQSVMVTNGATEAIYMVARAFRNRQPVIPQPAFAEYADACQGHGDEGCIHWLCIPNNPTGYVMPRQELQQRMEAETDDIYVIDASYAAYTRRDVLTAAEAVAHGNAIMLCSMTKDYGVPGLRLGYAVADARLLDRIRGERMPWSVNALAIEAGHYLLAHRAEYCIPLDHLIDERCRMERALHAMGITTQPSHSHMLLCRLPHGTAGELKEHLARQHGILIRDASNFATLTPQHFRIAMQTAQENDELIKAIRQWI